MNSKYNAQFCNYGCSASVSDTINPAAMESVTEVNHAAMDAPVLMTLSTL